MANIADLKVGDKIWVDYGGWEKATVVDINEIEVMAKINGYGSLFCSLTGRKWFKRNETEVTVPKLKIKLEPWHIWLPVAILILLMVLIRI